MKNLFTLCFISLTVVLITLELVIRIFFAENMSGRFEYGYHPTAGFVEEKDGTVNLVRAGGRRFRPQAFQMPKPAENLRVFVIGDSVPRGPSLEAAYAWQLQAMLKEKGLSAEVLNLAIAGNGVRRSRIIIDQALDYNPDLIILHLNYSNEFEDERESRRAADFSSWHPAHWLIKSRLIARLYELKTEKIFWFWLPQSIREQQSVGDADAELTSQQNKGLMDQWMIRVREKTGSTLEMLHQKKYPVIVVVQCGYEKGRELEDHHLTDFIRRQQPSIPFVSMKETFSLLEAGEFFSDGAHLRKSGHRVLAEKLLPKVLEITKRKEH